MLVSAHSPALSAATGCSTALSPLPSPLLSPSLAPDGSRVHRPKRRRGSSDERAIFLFSGQETQAEGLQSAIDASLQEETKRRLVVSLAETRLELESHYPDEMSQGSLHGARRRASSELSEFVARSAAASLNGTPAQKGDSMGGPGLPLPPPLDLPEAESVQTDPLSLGPWAAPAGAGPTTDGAPVLMEDNWESRQQMLEHDGLFDHEQLMQAIYASQGLDFEAVQSQASSFLDKVGLRPHDVGVVNLDEQGNVLVNQCFYLAIARSYLGHEALQEDCSGLALRLKRDIEAAVLAERPNWVAGAIGEEAMAFADFLPIAMNAGGSNSLSTQGAGDEEELPTEAVPQETVSNILSELAICVLDSTGGHVEVYLGPRYDNESVHADQNLVLLWYTPGHYQSLVCNDGPGSKVVMTYQKFKELLTEQGVVYIETTE